MFQCWKCRSVLPTLREFQRHISRSHNVEGDSSFPCCQDGCCRSFSSLGALYKHLRNCHKNLNENHYNAIPSPESKTLVDSDEESESEEPSFDVSGDADPMHAFDLNELKYILRLFQINNINRSNVINIIQENILLNEMKGLKRPFVNLDTEYLIIKALKSLHLWNDPRDVNIDYQESYIQKFGCQAIASKPLDISIIPLSDLIRFHFSSPQKLKESHKYMSNTSTSIIRDVKDVQHFEPYTFPYVLYFDEIEVGNALGSHKGVNKLGMFYMSLRCMHPSQYSKLDNILIYTCVPPNLNNHTNLDKILNNLVEEINFLYVEGLTLHGQNVKFKMLGLVGDNLGQHQILGFTESFGANYWCIRCKSHRDSMKEMISVDKSSLRTPTNYSQDLTLDNLSQTGIGRECVLNKVVGYHVTCDIIFDLMHDMHEGVCDYGMCMVLENLCQLPDIDIEVINNRIQCFQFGSHTNRPIPINKEKIERRKLGMSASEMANLVKYFSLIVGDLVPYDNEAWGYYLVLQQILEILLKKQITRDTIDYLDKLINEHHSLYISLSGELLKPKFHNMLHYSECLLRFGPLCHNWSMRFEAMHYKAKMYAHVVKSRVNICKSIMLRHNYTVAHKVLDVPIDSYPRSETDSIQSIEVNGTQFQVGALVAVSGDTELQLFGIIEEILLDGGRYGFVLSMLETLHALPHRKCFVCKDSSCGYKVLLETECSFPLVYKLEKDLFFISAFDI